MYAAAVHLFIQFPQAAAVRRHIEVACQYHRIAFPVHFIDSGNDKIKPFPARDISYMVKMRMMK